MRQSAAADSEFENLFSERDEDVVSDMTTTEYLAALRYRSKAKPVAPSLAAVVEYVAPLLDLVDCLYVAERMGFNYCSSTTDEAEEKHDASASAITQAQPTDSIQKELLQILMTGTLASAALCWNMIMHSDCMAPQSDHIMHFDTLLPLLPKRTEQEVVTALQHVAVSVSGRLLPRRYLLALALPGPTQLLY